MSSSRRSFFDRSMQHNPDPAAPHPATAHRGIGSERRLSSRVRFGASVVDDSLNFGQVLDISAGGMLVALPTELVPGQIVELLVRPHRQGGARARVQMRIVRRHPSPAVRMYQLAYAGPQLDWHRYYYALACWEEGLDPDHCASAYSAAGVA